MGDLASHGVYDESDPLLSGVVLADGRLTVEQLTQCDLSAGLITLSACVTGLATRRPGDELLGLSRAAALAGAPSVLTTLWNTNDRSSPEFFEHFYGALTTGVSKPVALLHAQHMLLSTPEFCEPLHWAPYVLMGDWR